jgi:hypothetical protein
VLLVSAVLDVPAEIVPEDLGHDPTKSPVPEIPSSQAQFCRFLRFARLEESMGFSNTSEYFNSNPGSRW